MVFNFPPPRVQQRSIPKLESCTVYPGVMAWPGWARGDPASAPSVVWLQFGPSVRRVGWNGWCSTGLLESLWKFLPFPFCFPSAGKMWWLFVTYQTAQAILWGDLVKALGR